MLGRIAIAAMGGCFSQHPDTGAAEATYFPAESVIINASISKTISRAAGTTDWVHGFTDTEVWIKAQVLTHIMSGFPSFASLGTTAAEARPRAWFAVFVTSTGVQHYANENITTVSTQLNPTLVFTTLKHAGENVSWLLADGIEHSGTSRDNASGRANAAWVFRTGTDERITSVRFWGDYMHSPYYGVRWRRLPMRGVETDEVALFDVDANEFIEY